MAGRGLGKGGEGIVEPVQAELLPKQRGLGHTKHHKHRHRHHRGGQGEGGGEGGEGGGGERKRKRQRGGERNRRRKHAEAARAAKEAAADSKQAAERADEGPGLFGFINNSLGEGSAAAGNLRGVLGQPQVQVAAGRGPAAAAAAAGGGGGGGGVGGSRRDLAAHADHIGLVKVSSWCGRQGGCLLLGCLSSVWSC
jgi:hypothetical protein